MIPSDELALHLLDANGPLNGYYGADMVQEDRPPFNTASNRILVLRQQPGTADDDVVRNNIECYVFGIKNGDGSDLARVKTDSHSAHNFLLDNFKTGNIFGIFSVETPNGPYFTGQDRYYYRFTVRTHNHT